jgi:hypothetical protein
VLCLLEHRTRSRLMPCLQEASLAQLLHEQARLQEEMADMAARAAEAQAAHGAAAVSGVGRELAAARGETDMLRAALQRCFADYTTAVDALSVSEAQRLAADTAPLHHGHSDAQAAGGDAVPAHNQHNSWWHRGAAPRMPQPHQQAWGQAHHQGDASLPHHHEEPLWADDAEAIRYANAMADRT